MKVGRLVTTVLVVVLVVKPSTTVAVVVEVSVLGGMVTVLQVRVVEDVDVVDFVVLMFVSRFPAR